MAEPYPVVEDKIFQGAELEQFLARIDGDGFLTNGQLEEEFGTSSATVSRTLKENKVKTYSLQIVPELKSHHAAARVEKCTYVHAGPYKKVKM